MAAACGRPAAPRSRKAQTTSATASAAASPATPAEARVDRPRREARRHEPGHEHAGEPLAGDEARGGEDARVALALGARRAPRSASARTQPPT